MVVSVDGGGYHTALALRDELVAEWRLPIL